MLGGSEFAAAAGQLGGVGTIDEEPCGATAFAGVWVAGSAVAEWGEIAVIAAIAAIVAARYVQIAIHAGDRVEQIAVS